jgi:putative transcriptional regulator
MTQEAFARRFGFSVAAVRDWEQGRRHPEQAARILLLVIDYNPTVVSEALAGVA